jgi:DNA adenine methylase
MSAPFVKWVGGKRKLISELRKHIPASFGTYYEPFVGGGALFWALRPASAILSDANARLVNAYVAVRDRPDAIIDELRTYPYERKFYGRTRALIDEGTSAQRAARFIYLNRTGFNGLYRVNRRGEFNVPFGRYANPTICDAETLRACSAALRGVEIVRGDFADVLARAKKGDFVYCDPPYVPLSATSSFAQYTADGFMYEDQRRLRDIARDLKRRGVHVLLSNSGPPIVRELYADGFDIREVLAARAISCKGDKRGAVKEVLIT